MSDEPSGNLPVEHMLEPDQSSDRDSAYSEDINNASFTTSIATSILKYRTEYGRTYHSYKDGQYQFPNDEPELDRLDLQHHIFLKMLDDALFLAPISKSPQNVLDVGTGTGIWAVDFADLYPSASVLGTDLSPTQPMWVPTNLHFEIDDSNDTWTYSRKFDFIHCRELHMAIEEKRLMKQSLEALQPGGWLEMEEISVPLLSDDGSLDGTALHKFSDEMLRAGQIFGTPFDNPYKYKQWMEEAGFVNVQEKVYPLPVSPWPKNKKMKQLGGWENLNFTEGLEGFCLMLSTKYLGWSKEQLEVWLVDVRKDLADRRIHAYFKVFCVFGQKPNTEG